MAHETAHHIHVQLTNVKVGPGAVIADLLLDDVTSISFTIAGIIAIQNEQQHVEIDFHDLDDITVVATAEAVTFTIIGN